MNARGHRRIHMEILHRLLLRDLLRLLRFSAAAARQRDHRGRYTKHAACFLRHHRYDSSVAHNGRIKQSLAYWCLNATRWQWDVDRICAAAVTLGCGGVAL